MTNASTAPRRGKTALAAFGRWVGRIVGTALIYVLMLAMLPYAARFLATVMPSGHEIAKTISQVLTREMVESARLETAIVHDTGVIFSQVSPFGLTVQTVKINYDYDASLGIDLSKVTASVTGNTITFSLPPIEVLSDSLTPTEVQVDQVLFDLKEDRRQALQEERRIQCRMSYIDGDLDLPEGVTESEAHREERMALVAKARENTLSALDKTISGWLGQLKSNVTIRYEWAEPAAE